MEYNNNMINHTLKVYGFNLDNLDINKIQHVPMHEYRLSTLDKPLLYIENLQCCVGLFIYGNGFGFASHINPVVIRNNEFITLEDKLICNRCNDLLNSVLSYKGNIYEPFKIGITLGIMPLDNNEKTMVSIYNGTKEAISILRSLNIPVTDLVVLNKPEMIIDTNKNTIIIPKKERINIMRLSYNDEIIISPDGIECLVLDTNNVDFTDAPTGRKCKETIVLKTKGNERIDTINSQGLVESTYITKPGEAIFYNSEKDKYVPRDSNGTPIMFDDLENFGFEVTCEPFQFSDNIAVKVKSTNKAYLLQEIIEIPTCIKDAWGKGDHQFLFKGATLKKEINSGKVTGIEKEAFDKTWEIFEQKEKSR